MVFIPTVVYIPTVVSSLSDYSPQHSPHSYFLSAYPACMSKIVCICKYGRNNLILTNLLFAGKESSRCKPSTTEGKTQMTALVKGSAC